MPDKTAFAIVDAFTTEHPFSGNPAGVLLLDEFPDPSWMQGVANELAQAETAFLAPGEAGALLLRWFTPVTEVALCGHATLASAHWLWESGVLQQEAVAFMTRSGRLTAVREHDRIVLDFPAVPATQVTPSSDLRTALAGAVPVWAGVTDHPDAGERNMLAVLASEGAVRDLSPDLQAVVRLPVGGLIVTARRRVGGVVSRYFAPAYGIPEDPVTGSAHCTIGPYWCAELGTTLSAEQASPRGGELTVVTTDAGRVLLAGQARTAATGFVL
ncbi:PhzF family phenazine biosynthesis protein [Geodermatophilus sp. CPCC 205506]|uniref:PhzF family phenazine biosynthesis protein n=1 Tax=Geodermatophilus sp. CPCC 205506 TaxID=2936596 RepID=UPI003EEF603A